MPCINSLATALISTKNTVTCNSRKILLPAFTHTVLCHGTHLSCFHHKSLKLQHKHPGFLTISLSIPANLIPANLSHKFVPWRYKPLGRQSFITTCNLTIYNASFLKELQKEGRFIKSQWIEVCETINKKTSREAKTKWEIRASTSRAEYIKKFRVSKKGL